MRVCSDPVRHFLESQFALCELHVPVICLFVGSVQRVSVEDEIRFAGNRSSAFVSIKNG